MDNPDKLDKPVTKSDTAPIASPATESGASVSSPTTSPTKTAWQGAFATYGQVFEQVKKNPQPAYLFIAVYTVLAIISTITSDGASILSESYDSYESIAWLVFILALPVYGLAIADRKMVTLAEVMKFDVSKFFYMLGALILASLIFIVSALPLLIPLIWTVAWFSLVQYPVVDKGHGPIEALKESKRLSENHKSKVWGMIGVTLLLGIPASAISFIPYVGGVISAAFVVLSTCAFAVLYRWLQREQPVA